jgi:hypothetical protein
MTPKHSANSVAAKFRKRHERATEPIPDEPKRYIPHPRVKAKWQFQLRDLEHGDSFTLRLFRSPWPGRWVYSEPHIEGLDDLFQKLRVMLNNAA